MVKGMCLGLPAVSYNNTLVPVLEGLASREYQMVYYNTGAFRPRAEKPFRFETYPASYCGYEASTIDQNIRYFKFGRLLVSTAASLIDFLREEVEIEKPDFILHSHLAMWGKLIARYYDLPAVSLLSTFIMDEQIMQPQLQKLKRGGPDFSNIREGKIYHQEVHALHARLGLQPVPSIWDAFINEEKLNVSMLSADLQPRHELTRANFKFAGLPARVPDAVKHEYVYVALGTVFNANVDFFKACIRVLHQKGLKGILSVGRKTTIAELGQVPDCVRVEQYVDQAEVLKGASIFITQGGLPSVQEAICTLTPMIVTPRITEQRVVAERIAELGIGIYLPMEQPGEEDLSRAIATLLDNYPYYLDNLNRLVSNAPAFPAAVTACNLIDDFLKTELKSTGRSQKS